MRRGSAPSFEKLQSICEVLDLEFYVGPRRPSLSAHQKIARAGQFVMVERFDVKLAAGAGASVDNTVPLAPVAFRTRWIDDQGLQADKCCVVSVAGDSMVPPLHDGDLVLIDRRKADVRSGHVYAFVDVSGDVRVKRLELHADRLAIRSENPTVPLEFREPVEVEQMVVIGRVAWSGHTWSASGQ
ncbi:hypothetical protein GLS40_03775 [Pseudooceanicola sp. 216_PA32_1]|uniref:Peptidase S24/S26A/S26B/S26C domain-containing protein n=1 Tax=Pseudooceanicola pacificus TaxID=2676438 RepID=A0A844VZD1_9RHOB|nr:hypothetical protein [Pseudooceanicola pacificus]